MRRRRSLRWLAATLGAGCALCWAQPAGAGGGYPPGAQGYDISWPQCGNGYPDLPEGQFAIVGVNGGRPYTANPCLRSEFAWALRAAPPPSLYVNLQFGTSPQGPNRCGPDNEPCAAYNYGYGAAQYAFMYAYAATMGASVDVTSWWLDVETGNSWSADSRRNSQVIRGAVDYLQRVRARQVGVYSTRRQWRMIAGQLSLSDTGNWVAGASDAGDLGKCGAALWPGAQVWLFQYLVGDYDQDRSC